MSIFKRSKYLDNLAMLLKGTMLAQFLLIAFSPILTRLYTPENLGVYSSILAISSIIIPLSCGRYEFLIVSSKNEPTAKNHVLISFIFLLLTSILLTLILSIIEISNITSISSYYWFLIPIVFVGSLNSILIQYLNRQENYKMISNVTVIKSIVQIGSQTILGLFSFGTIGLIFSIILSSIASLKKQVKATFLTKIERYQFNKAQLMLDFKSNINQLKISLPAAALTATSANILVPFVALKYGATIAGFYYLTTRILAMPIQIFGTSISKIFYKSAVSEYHKIGVFNKPFLKAIGISSIALLPLCLIIYIFSEKIVLIFGSEWSQVSNLIKILVPYYFFRGIALSIIMTPYVLKKQKLDLINQSIILIVLIGSFVVAFYADFDFNEFFQIFSIAGSVSYVLVIFLCAKFVFKKGDMYD